MWKTIPDRTRVYGGTTVTVMQDHSGKPVLKLSWGKIEVYISTNQGEMIGGFATGARLRWEENKLEK